MTKQGVQMKEVLHRTLHPFVLYGFVVIMALHVIISINNLYNDLWWVDIFMHGAGGFWVAGSAFLVLGYAKKNKPLNFWAICALLTITLFVGIAWEVFEVFVGWVPAPKFGSTPWFGVSRDTLGDLVMDVLGGILFLPLTRLQHRSKEDAKGGEEA